MTDEGKILERWAEYFKELLDTEKIERTKGAQGEKRQQILQITKEELDAPIAKLEIGKHRIKLISHRKSSNI